MSASKMPFDGKGIPRVSPSFLKDTAEQARAILADAPSAQARQEAERRVQASSEAKAAQPVPSVSVLVADDQDLVRNGFRLILSSYKGIDVVGEARDGDQACEMARALRPDVVLMDVRMPRLNGIEATRRIVADPACEGTHVLMLTTFDVDEYVYDALAAGASGFMLKDAEPDDIAHAVRTVAKGDALIQPSITKRLIEAFVGQRPAQAPDHAGTGCVASLTDRERQVLVLVARGLDNESIGDALGISPATAKTHVARVMGKLGAHDRAQLVVDAYESGLVTPSAGTGR